jgi:hypothetical protein
MRYLLFLAIVLQTLMCTSQDRLPLLFHETFDSGSAENWQPNLPENWQVIEKEGRFVYELSKAGTMGQVRKPTSISILEPYIVDDFELEVSAQCYTDTTNKRRDLVLVYGYQDSLHFYYTHFSAISDNVHNIIAIVNKADRAKINIEPVGQSIAPLTGYQWFKLRVTRDSRSGRIECFVDAARVLTATDTTFSSGRIGIGSFDDTGAFREIKLWGKAL